MPTDSRESIIRKGAEIVHAKGFRGSGLQEILHASGIPKGSFYFYFKSKEDFGLAIVDYYSAFIRDMAERHLGEATVSPLDRLERFMESYTDMFERMGHRCGCPVGNLIQEMSDLSEPFREKLKAIYTTMHDYIAELLREARRRKDIPAAIDPDGMAWFILDGWEGAIMHMKLAKSSEPLDNFRKHLFGLVLKKTGRAR